LYRTREKKRGEREERRSVNRQGKISQLRTEQRGRGEERGRGERESSKQREQERERERGMQQCGQTRDIVQHTQAKQSKCVEAAEERRELR
jgi:hypothetical protein